MNELYKAALRSAKIELFKLVYGPHVGSIADGIYTRLDTGIATDQDKEVIKAIDSLFEHANELEGLIDSYEDKQ
jgi:hypothetical protein